MNQFLNDLKGIVMTPAQTIASAMERKKWVPALALVLAMTWLFSYLSYPVVKAEGAKMMRNSPMADRLSEEQLDGLDKFTPVKRFSETAFQILFQALMLIIATFFIYLFYKLGSSEGLYSNFFTGVCYASIIDMVLGGAVKTVLVLSKKSLLVSTSLTLLFPQLEIRSPAYVMLSQFDLFTIWFLVALALGVATYSRMKVSKSLGIAAAYFAFRAVVLLLFTIFFMRIMGG